MADLRAELEAVRDRHGRLTPAAVVIEATPEDSPLHDHFEWRDEIAAHEHRLAQARELIRMVTVRYVGRDGPTSIRGYLSVERVDEPGGREYVPTEEVAQDPLQREIALRAAERELRSLMARYDYLQEFFDLAKQVLKV